MKRAKENPGCNKKSRNKKCIVPGCDSRSHGEQNKIFINVPTGDIRKKWLKQIRCDTASMSFKSHLYCCEDHFNVQEDVENYIRVKLDPTANIRLRKGALPRFFNCQPDRKRSHTLTARPAVKKLQIARILAESEGYGVLPSNASTSTDFGGESAASESIELAENTNESKNMELAMEFATFCNICFIKENLRKVEETEHLLSILMMFNENKIVMEDQEVYLCLNCCEKLKSYDQFKKMCLRNFFDFRVEYSELKKNLETNNDPNVENKLRNFIETKVYRTGDTIKPNGSEDTTEYNVIFMQESKNNLTEKNECRDQNYDFHSVTCKTEEIEYEDEVEYKFHTELDLENSEDNFELPVQVEKIKEESCVEDIGVNESSSKNELRGSSESVLLHSREDENHTITDLTEYKEPALTSTLNINAQPTSQKIPENKCEVCKETFVHVDILKEHMQIHNGEKPFVCTVCNKSFTKSSTLKEHEVVHTGEKRYTCDICNKTYSKLSNLKSHQHSHTGKKPYVCNICNKTYAHLRTLKAHECEHTGKMPHICNICNKAFSLPERLKGHMHIHSNEKPHTCLVCNKTFRKLVNLKEHERVHTGEKPYACSMCEKTFGTSGYLKLHLLVHTGEKPYACGLCEKSFRHISHLKVHERVHIDEKPYECTVCNKRFTHLNSYKSHKLTHTGEKPHSCSVCKSTFRHLSTLRRHERTHTEVKPLHCCCDACKTTYSEKSDLRLHQHKPCILNIVKDKVIELSEET